MKPSPAEMRALRRRDPVLAKALDRLGPFPGLPDRARPRQRSHFQSLARAVIYQAVSTKAANVIEGRVCALAPGAGFPRAREFAAMDEPRLRGAGLSGTKSRAILELARRVEDGSLPLSRVARMDDQAIVERLSELPGIGEWTAQMFLIFRLGRMDVMPAGDLSVREGARLLDGLDERPTPRLLLERAEVWRPLRTVAAWLFWELVHEAERT